MYKLGLLEVDNNKAIIIKFDDSKTVISKLPFRLKKKSALKDFFQVPNL